MVREGLVNGPDRFLFIGKNVGDFFRDLSRSGTLHATLTLYAFLALGLALLTLALARLVERLQLVHLSLREAEGGLHGRLHGFVVSIPVGLG